MLCKQCNKAIGDEGFATDDFGNAYHNYPCSPGPSQGFTLDTRTLTALQPLLKIYENAMRERDAWNKWSIEIASLLQIPVGEFESNVIAEQYAELRERITSALWKQAKADSIN